MTAAPDIAARVVAEVTLEPLPSRAVSKNQRGSYHARHAEFQRVLNAAYIELRNQCGTRPNRVYPRLVMHVAWYAVQLPDADAVVTRVGAVMDAAERVGLVADDALIDIGGVTRVRVAHKREQRCVVTFCEMREERSMTTQQPSASALTDDERLFTPHELEQLQEREAWLADINAGRSTNAAGFCRLAAPRLIAALRAARAEADAERRRRVAFERALRDIDMAYWDSGEIFERADEMLTIANNALRADEDAVIAADDAATEGAQP